MGLASPFAGVADAVRMILSSDAALEPARKLTKTLDQGLGAVGFCHSRLDVPEPRHVCLARVLAQGLLGVLQFPK